MFNMKHVQFGAAFLVSMVGLACTAQKPTHHDVLMAAIREVADSTSGSLIGIEPRPTRHGSNYPTGSPAISPALVDSIAKGIHEMGLDTVSRASWPTRCGPNGMPGEDFSECPSERETILAFDRPEERTDGTWAVWFTKSARTHRGSEAMTGEVILQATDRGAEVVDIVWLLAID